ncbi:hypothetical protein BH10PSE7_BH10PSE7_39970 [soil metagenome]
MRKTLTLLAASTALTAAIGLSAWSAINPPAGESPRPFAALFEDLTQPLPLILAGNDDDNDDDDDGRGDRETPRRGHDDDDDGDCDDDGDEECLSGAGNPAPAGTPPQNGLFGNGAPPQFEVN